MYHDITAKKELTHDTLLSEHLRPTSFDDLTLNEKIKSQLQKMHQQNNIMNMLFYGRAGTGKTTAAMILANNDAYDVIYCDISLNNDSRYIRDLILNAATTISVLMRKRVIIFDEVDALSESNQNTLKITMEQVSDYCRFIFITNNPDKIIEPIKSRLKSVCFDQIPLDSNVLVPSHIKTITEKMKSIRPNLSEDDIRKIDSIVRLNNPDYRKIANELEFEFI